jgi:hypothetical protein
MSGIDLRRDLLILACAISAGIHGALVPPHLEEGREIGVAFAVATVLLAASAAAVSLRPRSALAAAAATGVLGGALVLYVLAITTGLPVLHPHPEPADTLGIATKAIEAVGVLAGSTLVGRRGVVLTFLRPKGRLT